MSPIKLIGSESYPPHPDELFDVITSRAQAHRESCKAKSFCFILSDQRTPGVEKMLYDEDYWQALNSISGDCLTVFHFWVNKNEHLNAKGGVQVLFQMSPLELDEIRSRNTVDTHFNLNNVRLPALIFFNVDAENNIVLPRIYQFKADDMITAYSIIKKVVSSVVENALMDIKYENIHNYAEIQCLVNSEIDRMKLKEFAAVGVRTVISLAEIVGAITTLIALSK